jgi:hypothetical protein
MLFSLLLMCKDTIKVYAFVNTAMNLRIPWKKEISRAT